jgi:ribosomal protein S6
MSRWLYVLIIEFRALSALMKQLSHKIVDNGGLVRSIQNHGIRQFPHRVQAKNPDYITGQRYFEKGRYISVYYDSNPATRDQVETILSMNDQVLRNAHLKARSKLDWITMQRPERNPYVQQLLRMDQQKEEEAAESMIEGAKR